jgi:plasmid stabilization system protein ParE
VAKIVYSDAALSDIERAFEFLAERDPYSAGAAVVAIRDAISMLAEHPLIGRTTGAEPMRELVISFGRTGYLALYRFRPERDEVRILGLRHQRELDYPA